LGIQHLGSLLWKCQTGFMLYWTEYHFDGGPDLRISASSAGVREIHFLRENSASADGERNDGNNLLVEAGRQLRAYFASDLRAFDLPLDMQGTTFQLQVWRQLLTIPFGQTRSYMQVAEAIGKPRAIRAVGAANGANPVAIVVPCHRVIGSGGTLVGYGGGLPLKQRLLELEGAISGRLIPFAGPHAG
jgi:methylated-DNA-[protein]-cysteine S-methyltransferase